MSKYSETETVELLIEYEKAVLYAGTRNKMSERIRAREAVSEIRLEVIRRMVK